MSIGRLLVPWFVAFALVVPAYTALDAAIHQIPEFSQAANEVAVLVNKPNLTHDEQIRIAELTCKALTALVNDQDFAQAMNRVSANTRAIRLSGVMQYINDATAFAHDVVATETNALTQLGLNNESSRQALGEMERMRQELAQNPDKLKPPLLSPQHILLRIASVAQIACDLESRLRQGKDSDILDMVKEFRPWMAGVALIAADALVELPSEGISSLSIEIGANLIKE